METRPTMRFIRKQIEGRILDAERCSICACSRSCDTGESLGKSVKLLTSTAMTNARFAAFHRVSVAPCPSRPNLFHSANRALVTGWYWAEPQWRRASVGGRRAAFHSGSVPLGAPRRLPLHFPARRPPTEARFSELRGFEVHGIAF
jgi:hypothetical protein